MSKSYKGRDSCLKRENPIRENTKLLWPTIIFGEEAVISGLFLAQTGVEDMLDHRLADIHDKVLTSRANISDWKSISAFISQLMLPFLG